LGEHPAVGQVRNEQADVIWTKLSNEHIAREGDEAAEDRAVFAPHPLGQPNGFAVDQE
jgi:hypothetical protein